MSRWWRYGASLALVALSTLVGSLVRPYFSLANLVMLYLLGVVVAAIYLGRGPAILASAAGVLAFDFFLVPPRRTLAVADSEYLLTFLALFGVGLLISNLAARLQAQAESARQRESETAALYALSRDLATADSPDAIAQAVVTHADQMLGRTVTVLLPSNGPTLLLEIHPQDTACQPDRHEMAAALQALRSRAPAGRGTPSLPEARGHYLPLETVRGIVGVLGVCLEGPHDTLEDAERRLLEAFTSQTALAIERAQLAQVTQQVQVLQATEKLQGALLNSISHDLRTPLVTVTGTLSTLEDEDEDEQAVFDPQARRALVRTAREEAERLNRLVENLLNMSRIEAGALHVTWQPGDVEDVVGSALEALGARLQDRPIAISVPDTLPLLPMDFVLIVHVLVNVIDNALKYSPAGSPVEIRAWEAGGAVCIQVEDRGIGVPPEDLEHIFDKFYRVQRPGSVAGTGLGLAISKGIVEAHGGSIWAENRPGGGTRVVLTLPKEQTPLAAGPPEPPAASDGERTEPA